MLLRKGGGLKENFTSTYPFIFSTDLTTKVQNPEIFQLFRQFQETRGVLFDGRRHLKQKNPGGGFCPPLYETTYPAKTIRMILKV